MLVFLLLAYVVSCVASGVMTNPSTLHARFPEGFFYRHQYLSARLGWGLWPVGVLGMIVLVGIDYVLYKYIEFMNSVDKEPGEDE